jgi:chaperonin cofactor prefoldin
MRLPKKLNKMNLEEQEQWLQNELFKLNDQSEVIRKQLAKVRGGLRVEVSTEERPDLEILKAS